MAFTPAHPGFGGFALDASSGKLSLGSGSGTANPGGGQANATPLTSLVNKISVVGTAGDSVLLPVSSPGEELIVINAAANSLNVFPQGNDTINALSGAAPYALAAAKTVLFCCPATGAWYTILSA